MLSFRFVSHVLLCETITNTETYQGKRVVKWGHSLPHSQFLTLQWNCKCWYCCVWYTQAWATHLTQIAVSKISSTSEANLILALVRSYLKQKEKARSSPDEQSAFKSRSVFPVDDFYIIMKTNSSLIFNEFPLVWRTVRSGEWSSGKTKHQTIAAEEKVVAVTVKKKTLVGATDLLK